MIRIRPRLAILLLAGAWLGCDSLTSVTGVVPDRCGPYPAAHASPYVLPIAVGQASLIQQANCGPYTHSGRGRYAFDFQLAPGIPIHAARGGVVVSLAEQFVDGVDHQLNSVNFVRIDHGDSTVAGYYHLQQNGVLVEVGDAVATGDLIAIAGFTGFTGPIPHLHFEVRGCLLGCETVAVTFSNADPPDPGGLQMGAVFTALP